MHLPSDANAKPCLMELSMLLFFFHYPKLFIQSSLTCFFHYTTTKFLTSSLTTMDNSRQIEVHLIQNSNFFSLETLSAS